MTVAIYAGSFDPITNGHIDILRGSLTIAENVVIAIGIHHKKTPLFSFEERVELVADIAKTVLKIDTARIKVVAFDGLLVDKAREVGASIIVRGLRDSTDFDYEMQMSGMNAAMVPEIQTVFLPANSKVRSITATLVRQIASMGGDVSSFVPKNVAKALCLKFKS